MTIQPGTDIGRYHILEQLGEGGMAVVYKAYDTRLETEVAIKVIRTGSLPPDALPRVLKRFQIEARKMARMTHPNIVKVMDYGEFEGAPYLVMPFLPGGTLKDKLGKAMLWQDVVDILLPIANALQYAHEQGLIHRDIKPSNILITQSGQPMLSDFGVAKVLESEETLELTVSGIGVGTPEYMAPEQAEGKAIDMRADVYSLGVVFYELVTGRKPFMADTPMAVIVKQMRDPLPQPSQFVPEIPAFIEKILFKTLAKDPNMRYASMTEFAKALESFTKTGKSGFKCFGFEDQNETKQIIPKIQIKSKEDFAWEREPLNLLWLYWGVGILGIGLVLFAGLKLIAGSAIKPTKMAIISYSETPISNNAATHIDNLATIFPTNTFNPVKTPTTTISTFTPAPSATPTIVIKGLDLDIGSTILSEKDNMVMLYVPEGEFLQGTDASNWPGSDAKPQRSVYLDAFWIDKYEVSHDQFVKFLNDIDYEQQESDSFSFYDRDFIFEDNDRWYVYSGENKYPVSASWEAAQAYCKWAGRTLPTEVQWEKAARGTDGRKYPWGNRINCEYANFAGDYWGGNCPNFRGLSTVDYYIKGASPYGVLNMAGNVSEWVSDWYDSNYYSYAPLSNPTGPVSGTYHVVRGGSLNSSDDELNSAYRSYSESNNFHGIRCAMDAK